MSLKDFLFGAVELRQGNYHPSNNNPPIWMGVGNNTTHGIEVTRAKVEAISAVYSCVRVLASSIGSMPMCMFKEEGDTILPDNSHPLVKLIKGKPNPFMNIQSWLEVIVWELCFRGNSYHKITRDNSGKVVRITPLEPDNIRLATSPKGDLVYVYKEDFRFLEHEVLHFKSLGSTGYVGETPINITRNLFAGTIAGENYATRNFAKNANPSGILTVPGRLEEKEIIRLRNDWDELYGVESDNSTTAVLEQGTEWKPVSITARDAEFITTQKYNRSQICGVFGVPPHMIGDMDGAKYDNIEAQGINLVRYALMPIMKRIELTIKCAILSTESSKNRFVKLNADSLMRGDTQSRYEAHRIGIEAGFLSRNEARKMEDRNPEEGLDEFIQPLNMGTANDGDDSSGDSDVAGGDSDDSDSSRNRVGDSEDSQRLDPILNDCIKRINTKFSKKKLDGQEDREVFIKDKMVPFMHEILKPLATVEGLSDNELRQRVGGYSIQLLKSEKINDV